MPTGQRSDLAWFLKWVALLLGAASLPFLVAWWLTPSSYQFSGLLLNPLDGFSYLAKMRQTTEGGWITRLPYSLQEHSATFIFPQYLLLGKVTAFTGLPALWIYHGARVAAGLFLLAMIYVFLHRLIQDDPVRRSATLLAIVGGGLTWLTSLFGVLGADVTIPESTTFASVFSNPHFPLATGLLLLLAWVVLAEPSPSLKAAVLGGVANLFLVLMQPFLWATQVAVGGLWALLLVFKGRSPFHEGVINRALGSPWRWKAALLMLGVPSLALAAYARQLYGDPVLAQWTAQNITLSPPPTSYLIGYGALTPLALVGLLTTWRTPETVGLTPRGALFIIAWALADCALLYAPLPFQRRFSEGLQVPLAVLAAAGLHSPALLRLGEAAHQRLRTAIISVGMAGILWLAGTAVLGAQALREPHYLRLDDGAALAWLAAEAGRSDLVLASPTIGNLAPAWSAARVYWGHPFETPDQAAREAQVRRFYQADTPAPERCRLLQEGGVTLVYWGAVERRLGGAMLDRQPGLASVYQNPSVTIFSVADCPFPG